MRNFLLSLLILPVVISTSGVNIFIYTGTQEWTEIAQSTVTTSSTTVVCPAVAVSSCAVMMADPFDCYQACIQSNGTLKDSPAKWIPCPQ
jgi:hypothetical protein